MKVDKLKMTEMWSQQGEKVPFDKPVEAKGVSQSLCSIGLCKGACLHAFCGSCMRASKH